MAKTDSKTKKEVVKSPKKVEVKAQTSTLLAPVYSLVGKESGYLDLPKEIFGTGVNNSLLKQALRVYMTNQKSHWSNTKTRSEVVGTTKKLYRQKGTGGARHGSKKAPIFVSGGIALGPKYRKTELNLPKKMKKAALFSSLSSKALENEVFMLEGVDKMVGKTKEVVNLLKSLNKKSTLFIVGDKNEALKRATRNLANVNCLTVENINAFEVVSHQSVILTKDALAKLTSSDKEEVKPVRAKKMEVVAKAA